MVICAHSHVAVISDVSKSCFNSGSNRRPPLSDGREFSSGCMHEGSLRATDTLLVLGMHSNLL